MRINVNDNPRLASQVRCWLNDTDVSRWCFEADDEKGYACCYLFDAEGRIYHEDGRPIWKRYEGEVRFSLIFPSPLERWIPISLPE